MKILYFHQHFSTPYGSTGTRSYEMAKRLIYYGHDVTLICGSYAGGDTGLRQNFNSGKREGVIDGIRIIEFNLSYKNSDNFFKRSIAFIIYALRSLKIVLSRDYEMVIASSTPLTAGIPGIIARWFLRKPFIFEVRDLWPELPKKMGVIKNPIVLSALSILEWVSYRSAVRCIGLSPGIVDGIKNCGVSEEKIAMIPNGCDLSIFNKKINRFNFKNFNSDDFLAIYAGTHGLANGLDAVLNAGLVLKNRSREDIKIILVGQGMKKEHLQKRAEDMNLKNIIFLNPLSKNDLSKLFSVSDIGLQILANVPAFYYGTSPNKFFDYISAGLPVINNYPGWIADIISKEQCGFAIEPDNPILFADTIEFAADNKETLKKYGQNSLQLAIKKFDRLALADEWVKHVVNSPLDLKK